MLLASTLYLHIVNDTQLLTQLVTGHTVIDARQQSVVIKQSRDSYLSVGNAASYFADKIKLYRKKCLNS
jgi:hypothetical protein